MDLNEMNENWQQEAPILGAMAKTNPFSLPEGYFEEMAKQLQSRIAVCQSDKEQDFFNVPSDYFDTLADKIIAVSTLEQLKENSDVFTVPDDYFNNLEGNITSEIRSQESKVKVHQLASSWITYVAAACITAIISLGIYLNTKNTTIENQIAELPADEIVNYLQLYSDTGDAPLILQSLEGDAELSDLNLELSDQEIKQYLEYNL